MKPWGHGKVCTLSWTLLNRVQLSRRFLFGGLPAWVAFARVIVLNIRKSIGVCCRSAQAVLRGSRDWHWPRPTRLHVKITKVERSYQKARARVCTSVLLPISSRFQVQPNHRLGSHLIILYCIAAPPGPDFGKCNASSFQQA